MQIAARDVGRLSRLVAGCAGVAAALFGVLTLLIPVEDAFAGGPGTALLPAGLALTLLVLPVPHRSVPAVALAAAAVLIGAAALGRYPAGGAAVLLAGLALALLDMRLPRPAGAGYRVADPLLGGATVIALVALVPRMFASSFPSGQGPGSVMSPYLAGALLTLTLGTILARPEAGPLRVAAAAGPGTTIRRVLLALIGVPVLAALVSAAAARTGVERPAAAVSTGAVLAAFAVLVLLGFLVHSLEGADRRQRELVAQLDDRRKFADTLVQSMNEAVMVLDANHRVIDVNRRWYELTGQPADAALGVRPADLPPTGTSDFSIRRADGSDVPVLATMAPVPREDGSAQAYVATYVDIAERKAAETALSDHATELEHGNARLLEANARLEAALAFKNDLTSMLTHDVAQPISSIASLSELLAADWADLGEDDRHTLAMKIDKNTRRLVKMMNDLQLLFRLDTGSVTARRTPVPLFEIVDAVVTRTGRDDITVAVDDDLAALADRGHLAAVVQNLLTNALAYGRAPVEIRGRRRGDAVLLSVEDHGSGVAAELEAQLFDRFVRGAGLGLFIVRHLVEANGGSVRHERVEPTGTRMVVTLEPAAI